MVLTAQLKKKKKKECGVILSALKEKPSLPDMEKKSRGKLEIRNIRLLSDFQPRLPLDNEKAMTDHPALFCSLEWH